MLNSRPVKAICDYWDAVRKMHLLMGVSLIAIVFLGLWLVFASYIYNAFPNSHKWISEFEYFIWNNRFFWGTLYALIALAIIWIMRAISLNVARFSDFSKPQKLALISTLIFLFGVIFRIIVHFVPN